MSVDLRPLTTADLAASKIVLAAACEFDRADVVAEEKLLGPAPAGPTQAWAAWRDGALVGVASACADRLRLLAVTPAARWRGVGSALLGAVEAAARARGPVRLRTLDQAGNYLAPGIDARNSGARTPEERSDNVAHRMRGAPRWPSRRFGVCQICIIDHDKAVLASICC